MEKTLLFSILIGIAINGVSKFYGSPSMFNELRQYDIGYNIDTGELIVVKGSETMLKAKVVDDDIMEVIYESPGFSQNLIEVLELVY